MKRALTITAALAAATLGGQAAAQQAYGNVGGVVNEGFDEFGVQARLGYDLPDQAVAIGFEGEVAYFNVDVLGQDFDVLNLAGFAKVGTPVTPSVSLFARAGYGLTEVLDTPDGVDGSESDFAYGVGAEFAVAPRSGVRVDYTRYEAVDEGFLSLNYVFRFGGAQPR